MRDPKEIVRDMEAATLCAKQGKTHIWKRDGEPINIFFDGPGNHGVWKNQIMVCERCGFEMWREPIELVGKGEK